MRLIGNFEVKDVGLGETERERERKRKSVNGPFARVVSCFHIVPLYHGVLSSGLCYERNPIVARRYAGPSKFRFGAPLIRNVLLCTHYSRHSTKKP